MKKTSLFLAILLLLCLCSCSRIKIGSFSISGHTYADANKYSVGSFSYRSSDVDRICLEYISGDVTVVQSANRTLNVSETEKGLSDDQKMHWYMDGRTLRIQFAKSGYSGTFPSNSKKLTLEIPFGVELELAVTSGSVTASTDLEVKHAYFAATSGDYQLKTVRTEDFEFGATSGSIGVDAVYADKAKFGSTSGPTVVKLINASIITFGSTSGNTTMDNITASEVEGASTSGNISLSFDYCEKLKTACTSGNVTISRIPKNGASIEYDKTSGTLKADGYMVKNNRMVFGEGGCEMDITTTSGNLIINN